MSLHLVTGYAGREHVTSADHGSFNIAFVGDGEYVFDRGQKFTASIIDNNTVDVADGDILMQGRHIRQIENHVTRLTFENGERGFYRNDLIVAEYRKDPETFVESATLKVLKGTQTDNVENVTDPEYTHGDITEATGAMLNQMPLYRVKFTGFEITAVERLFDYLPSTAHILDQMWEDVRQVSSEAQAWYEQAEAQFLQDLNNTEVSNQQAFQTWFDTIRVILDGDTAGHLQNEIDVNYGKTASVNLDVTNNTGNNATSLTELYNIISSNYDKGLKITYAAIGSLNNTAIKNVIQAPFNSNYIDLYIKFEAGRAVVSIFAIGAFDQKFAKCYLINDNANIFLTDWQVLKQ